MQSDDTEIIDALQHEQEMLRIKRRRLRDREQQQARYGINTPSEITIEIDDLKESIKHHEAELARLQTEAALDKEPMAEVEYRMLVAEAWDTPAGRPSVAAATRLEYNRLRLGVLPERAQQIEREIRSALVEQLFRQVERHFYRTRTFERPLDWKTMSHLFPESFNATLSSRSVENQIIIATVEYPRIDANDQNSLDTIVKCIYLDRATILKIYAEHFPKQPLKITDIHFEPILLEDLAITVDRPDSFIEKSKLISELFKVFSKNLYGSSYATGFRREHRHIGKFVNDLQAAVVNT